MPCLRPGAKQDRKPEDRGENRVSRDLQRVRKRREKALGWAKIKGVTAARQRGWERSDRREGGKRKFKSEDADKAAWRQGPG